MPRRPASPSGARSQHLGVRLTEPEAAAIAASAAREGTSSSAWARDLVLAAAGHGPAPPSADALAQAAAVHQLGVEVRRLGVNVNQLSRRVNASPADIAAVLDESESGRTLGEVRAILNRVLERLEDLG